MRLMTKGEQVAHLKNELYCATAGIEQINIIRLAVGVTMAKLQYNGIYIGLFIDHLPNIVMMPGRMKPQKINVNFSFTEPDERY